MSPRVIKRLILMVCICSLLSFQPASRVRGNDALVFNVDTTEDLADNAINSVCSAGDPTEGPCSLRAAVSEAGGNVPLTDVVINIPAGTYLLTIPPDETNDFLHGDLDIVPDSTSNFTVTINGIGPEPAIIDANQLDRVFDIGNVHVSMHNVVIRGGYLYVTEAQMWGAGIRNYGYLTLDHVVVEDNTLDCDPLDCPWSYGGAIYNANGSLDIIASTIQNNTSPDVSAIYNTSAEVTISHSTIRDNYASRGETIYHSGVSAAFKIINSTLAGNTSAGTAGILNYGNLYIASSTLANSGIAASIEHRYGSVTIQDSILYAVPRSTGVSYNCYLADPETPWTSYGHNIYSDDSCPADGSGDLVNTDPLLGPLDWWGGPTMTRPLLTGSPAIDHRNDDCREVTGLVYMDDQRYYPRDDGQCDTGAFEGFLDLTWVFLPMINR